MKIIQSFKLINKYALWLLLSCYSSFVYSIKYQQVLDIVLPNLSGGYKNYVIDNASRQYVDVDGSRIDLEFNLSGDAILQVVMYYDSPKDREHRNILDFNQADGTVYSIEHAPIEGLCVKNNNKKWVVRGPVFIPQKGEHKFAIIFSGPHHMDNIDVIKYNGLALSH